MVAALIETALSDDGWSEDVRSQEVSSADVWSADVWSAEAWGAKVWPGDGWSGENGSSGAGVDVARAPGGDLIDGGGLIGEPLPPLPPAPRLVRSPSAPSPAVIRRRRLLAGGVAGTILLGLVLGLQALFGWPGGGPLASVGSPAAAKPAAARVWVVHPGDTLWSIALASGARGDIRPLVARLSAEVGNRPLQPGQRVLVP